LFANSPYVEGRDTGLRTARSTVWTDVDGDRCGVPPFVFDATSFSFEQYVDWALAVPMFFVKREGTYHPHHATFAEFMRDGFVAPDGTPHHATWGDWITHLSTVFPEVRLKPYIEFRSADAVGSRHVCGLPALLTGILYDDDAAGEAWELLGGADAQARAEMWFDARHAGLSAPALQQHAVKLVELARAGLERRNILDDRGRTEARFVDSLATLAASGRTPADLVLADVGANPGRGPEGQRRLARSFYFAGVEV
jgi:glutamate--cysteine ligase